MLSEFSLNSPTAAVTDLQACAISYGINNIRNIKFVKDDTLLMDCYSESQQGCIKALFFKKANMVMET